MKQLNKKSMVAKFVTHAHSTYLITINFVIVCDNAFHLYMEKSPDPSFPMHDTESDLHWGWVGLACDTMFRVGKLHQAHIL